MSEYYEEYLVICSSELKWLLKKFVESIARAERRFLAKASAWLGPECRHH
jgi:hypothetical protein